MPNKILIVDDEADVELLIRQRFRREIRTGEYDFHFARNGEEALAAVQADNGIEVVLTDINMPIMDGLTFLSHLRERPDPPAAVVVSAYGDMPNIRAAMNRGAFDFLTKPIDFQDFEVTVQKTLEQVRRLRSAAADRDRLTALERDLSIAADIQRSFLPAASEGENTAFELHAAMIPARAVGGDFYDHFRLDKRRLGVAIGDVSGKGVSAALLMAVTRTLLRACALRGVAPGPCLEEVNRLLLRDTSADRFVTLFYVIVDVAEGTLHYANAGHNPPLLLRNGGAVEELSRGGLIAGAVPNAAYETMQAQLHPGDGLFLYTDGISEAMNVRREQFSCSRLQRRLRECDGLAPQALIDRVLDAVRAFTAGAAQSDDCTALAVVYHGSLGRPTEAGT